MKKILLILALPLLTLPGFTQGIVNSGAYLVITTGATVYVDGGTAGNYTSSGTSFIKSTSGLSTLTLEGNFTNNSTTNAIDGIAYSKILLAGGVQSIDGSKTSILGTVESAGSGAKTISTKQQISKLILNGQNVTLSDTVRVHGQLTLTSGGLTTAGKLILTSTVDSTANVTEITAGTISGDVIVQRFIPGGADKRKWRLLSSPINTDGTNSALSQYIDDIIVTGTGGVTNGFDACASCAPSIRTYDEATTGASSFGWTNPTNITNTVSKGTGVEVFVRGSRNVQDPFLNWSTPDNVTIDYIGALNTGTIAKSISYTNNSQVLADGFNLVGNPYASVIDWQAASGWTRTNMQNFAWIYDAVTGTYGVISTTGVKTGNLNVSRYIPSAQAFFVRTITGSAVFQFSEAIKAPNTPFNFFRAEQSAHPVISISLTYGTKKDMCLIEIDENATANGNDNSDAVKFYNDKINVYTITKDGIPLAINSMNTPASIDTVGLAVWNYDSTNIQLGTHQLSFDSLATLASNFNIYLLDKHLNSVTNLKVQNNYNYDVTADATSYGSNRFKLIFDATTGIENSLINSIISVYPNPANEELHIGVLNAEYANSSAKVIIRNLIGQTVLATQAESLINLNTIDITSLQEGAYIVEVAVEGKSIFKKIIKR